MSIITIPKALREKLGEDGSDALIEIINQSQSNQKADVIELVGETFGRRLSEEIAGVNHRIAGVEHRIEQLLAEFKEDHANLRAELKEDNANLRAELKEDNATLRAELKQDNANLKTELKQDNANLRTEIHTIRADLIKWMFIFWIGQVAAMAGILFMFFR